MPCLYRTPLLFSFPLLDFFYRFLDLIRQCGFSSVCMVSLVFWNDQVFQGFRVLHGTDFLQGFERVIFIIVVLVNS